jgi:flavin reductase (DIM6/NTAB) family NADH-FMN oxidoreductase RutF
MADKNASGADILKRHSFNPGTLLGPLPAVLVTVGDMEKAGVLTVAWCGILSSTPARAYVSVRPSRYSHRFLKENGEFVINLTTEELAFATDYAGIYTGAKVDKFEKLSLTKLASEKVSPPTIAQSPLSLECKVFEVLEMGTHDVFMADILSVSVRDDIIDEKGKICLERAGLLAYAHGEYFALGKSLGRFGFSTDKKAPSAPRAAKSASNAPKGRDFPKKSKSKKPSRKSSGKFSKRKSSKGAGA